MQFSTITLLALAGFVAAESGFTAPQDAPDGLYTVYRRDDGTEHHEAVDTTFSARFSRSAQAANPDELFRRDLTGYTPRVNCGANILKKADVDKANDMLDAQCGAGRTVARDMHIYSISGGTVAYYCNFNTANEGGVGTCTSKERQNAAGAITGQCGAYVPGWQTWDMTSSAVKYAYSYGYEASTAKFCGTGK